MQSNHLSIPSLKISPIIQVKSIFILTFLLLAMLLQSGCIVIGTAGKVATTTVNSTVSIVGHTAKTAIDVVVPDGDDD